MDYEIVEQVSELQSLLADFIRQSNHSLMVLTKNMDRNSAEIRDIQRRMDVEMKDFKDEMKTFKDEMRAFKDEMRASQDRAEKETRNMKKQWGELANKMGTLIEDLVLPATRPVLERYFGEEILQVSIRNEKRIKSLGLHGEFDIVALSASTAFIISVKSTPNIEKLHAIPALLERFALLFPEHKALKLVGIMASLQFPETLLPLASKEGVYLMAYREWDYMDLVNFEEVQQLNANVI